MLGKYINQFMADNELSVNEEFFILLRENYFIEKKPFYPAVGERYYFVSPTGRIEEKIFSGTAEGFLLCKYIGVYKTEQAAIKNVSRCLKFWEEVRRK